MAEALAIEIPPDAPGKTLIFAARDDHADMLVEKLRRALAAEYGPQPHDLVQKITGNPSVDRPDRKNPHLSQRPAAEIRRHRRSADDRSGHPGNLQSRVRAPSQQPHPLRSDDRARDPPAPQIGKEFFRIFDAVDIYANLQTLTEMRPVVSDPNVPLTTLIADLGR